MKKSLLLFFALCFAISTWAVDLSGRTFSNKVSYQGITGTLSYTFNSDGTLKRTMTVPRQGTVNLGGYWEMDGNYVHVVAEDLDDYSKVVEKNGATTIVILDSNGNPAFTLYEKKGSSGKSSSKGNSSSPKKKK